MHKPNILVVIPARGGSKGIPRKNLRPLAGKPLISYSINNAKSSRYQPDVYVSSEDDEIQLIASKLGANIRKRPTALAGDLITLDSVIHDCYLHAKQVNNKNYELIVTLQPTSPLLKTASLDAAIESMLNQPELETIISAVNDTHLSWRMENGQYVPNYSKRLNRQELTPTYKETGGFLICRSSVINPGSRIGSKVSLHELSGAEAIDIDSYEHWGLCEYYLKRKRILFIVSGYPEIGLGHTYNCLLLASEITDQEVSFLVDKQSELAKNRIETFNYPVRIQQSEDILEDIRGLKPDLIINDTLDTTSDYVKALKQIAPKLITIEDLGPGTEYADRVINAMYPEDSPKPGHYFGGEYFCIRDEFLFTPQKEVGADVKNVLVSFGGVDPNNLTLKTIKAIYGYCQENEIKINVVSGMGYKFYDSLKDYPALNIHKDVKNISDFMYEADIAFTSAGRTTFELASIGTPAIVLCQNKRETTHFFAYEEHGFVNMGMGTERSKEEILAKFEEMALQLPLRKQMSQRMKASDIRSGRQKVVAIIRELLREIDEQP